jgi:hypothetical protein
MTNRSDGGGEFGLADDPWDVFELNDEDAESEPQHGDFWGELDDDCADGN